MTDDRVREGLGCLSLALVLLLSGCGLGQAAVPPTVVHGIPTATSLPATAPPPTAIPAPTVTPTLAPTATPTETPTPSPVLLLPDLLAIPPQTAYIAFVGDQRYLRFDTSFGNVGDGPLRILGEKEPENEIVRAIQTLFTARGERQTEEIGEFIFHPGHEHWHLKAFARYELWSNPEEGPQEMLMVGEKVSFCMFDNIPYDLTLPNAPQERVFEECEEDIQGVSVGWADVYTADLAGQALNITGYPDGRYQIRITLNPADYIIERTLDNNETAITVELAGNMVEILEG